MKKIVLIAMSILTLFACGGYQIQFGAMKYTVDSTTSTTTYNGTAFSFAGAVKKGLILQ